MKVAVLLTCFNRKTKTYQCLRALYRILPDCDIYLVDDNSSDGTSEMVKEYFPKIHLIIGDGNLYWSRGMHLAWSEASKLEYDFYLWINDDVFLYDDAFDELMYCSMQNNHNSIISGIIESRDKSQILYGGSNENGLIEPNGKMNSIRNLNGNVVLIPISVFRRLGNLDYYYHHDLGDVDYGFRAQEEGIKVLTTRKPVAFGVLNSIVRVRKFGVSMHSRFKNLRSPLGSPPLINFYFRRKHFGILNAFMFVGFLYFLNVLPDFLVKFLFGKKYQ